MAQQYAADCKVVPQSYHQKSSAPCRYYWKDHHSVRATSNAERRADVADHAFSAAMTFSATASLDIGFCDGHSTPSAHSHSTQEGAVKHEGRSPCARTSTTSRS